MRWWWYLLYCHVLCGQSFLDEWTPARTTVLDTLTINNCPPELLWQWFGLTKEAVYAIVEYREYMGHIVDPIELIGLSGLSKQEILALADVLPFSKDRPKKSKSQIIYSGSLRDVLRMKTKCLGNQGRMEWGPRALGNRSIVANPGHPDMKDILNARIKRREWFRPFAPSILEDQLGEYFDSSHPSPFMLMVYATKEDKRDQLVAIDHVDHTGRVQSVSPETNALYHELIKTVATKTGIPVVLNTSFNENEPVVCTPENAIECFLRTKMDRLAIGSYFCTK